MTKSQFQEDIVKLFLRLNGYITTSLIIHSEQQGKNKTQIDVIASRFPFHSQEDRQVTSSPYLEIPSDSIDIILGEVKGGNEKNQFNSALRDRDSLEKLVKWIGIVSAEQTADIVNWLETELKPKEVNKLGTFPVLKVNSYSLRPIVFNLDSAAPRANEKKIVYGELILNYIWECFRPENQRATCSTTYPLNMWGHDLEPIVAYFKDKTKTSVGSIEDLYKNFNLVE